MKTKIPVLSLALTLLFCFPAFADLTVADLSRSIVQVRSIIPEDARTSKTLGTQREGSGVVIDEEGHILTVGYLILEAERVEIVTFDGQIRQALVVGYDHDTGFGLLRAAMPDNVLSLKLGKSESLASRDAVLIAGFGGTQSARGAYIITRHDYAGYWEYLLEDALYVSPAIEQFGGAALVDADGALIGIGSLQAQVMISGVGPVLCNIYIPIDKLKPILSDLVATGQSMKPPKPWLGMFVNDVRGHVIVFRTTSGGPSDVAGVKPNDIILSVGDSEIEGLADFYRKVWAIGEAGVNVPLKILRGTKIHELTVESANRNKYFRVLAGKLAMAL